MPLKRDIKERVVKRERRQGLDQLARQRALLVALSDDLALPLLHVKSAAEIMAAGNFDKKTTAEQTIALNLSAESGLQLVEAYRLLLKTDEILNMSYEPSAIGAILDEVAHRITPLAKQYDTEVRVDVQGRLTPVLAHKPSIVTTLEVLSSSLIRAQAAQSEQPIYHLVLGAHRDKPGVVSAGAFSDVHGISRRSLRMARALVGQARQPLPAIPPGAASGILVADTLCAALWQPLYTAAHRNFSGLATNLPTASQLNFV